VVDQAVDGEDPPVVENSILSQRFAVFKSYGPVGSRPDAADSTAWRRAAPEAPFHALRACVVRRDNGGALHDAQRPGAGDVIEIFEREEIQRTLE